MPGSRAVTVVVDVVDSLPEVVEVIVVPDVLESSISLT